jgi:uncharacterized membrane protein YkvA (DUF1232 family)
MARVTPWLARPSLLGSLVQRVRLSLRLLREPRVSLLVKAIPAAALVYLVSPVDFAPDFLPLLGQLDDLGVLFVALQAFLFLCPGPAVEFHKSALAEGRKYSAMPTGADYIDASFHREP